jgi:mannosyltransferase OCH1-like enzyme
MIPKKLHYVWVGGTLPDDQRRNILTWQAHNPGYEIVQWNEDNIDFKVPAIRGAYRQRRWSKVADIARLIAVHSQGGIYFDTDFEVIKPLDPLLRHRSFWSFQCEHHPTDWVCNGVFGAEPGHWFVKQALDRVLGLWPVPFGLEPPTRTGPKLITKMFLEHGLQEYSPDGVQIRDMFICPTQVFFPSMLGQEAHEARVTPETLAVHQWHKSWAKNLPLTLRAAIFVRARLHAARARLRSAS